MDDGVDYMHEDEYRYRFLFESYRTSLLTDVVNFRSQVQLCESELSKFFQMIILLQAADASYDFSSNDQVPISYLHNCVVILEKPHNFVLVTRAD